MAGPENPLRIGFVHLGQGLKTEIAEMHARRFRALGLEVEQLWEHVLDGLDAEACAGLMAEAQRPAIRARYGEVGGPAAPQTGWFDRDRMSALAPAAVERLEARGAALTIICAAEFLPAFRMTSRRPVVLPAEAMAAQAGLLLRSRPEARLGFVVYGDRQRRQQIEGLRARPEFARAQLVFCDKGDDPLGAAPELIAAGVDLTFLWAYGAGTAPGQPEALAHATGAPVIAAPQAAISAAIQFLLPSAFTPRGDGRSSP